MDILLWIVFGLVVGIVAKLIMPGHDPGGIILTIVLGIVGAMLGGWLGRVMGLYPQGEADGFIGTHSPQQQREKNFTRRPKPHHKRGVGTADKRSEQSHPGKID